ncbi:golgin subfamily A member 6-like protein 22 [Trachinotus anak]|uniref:golgin subfamily A member 6-like protein 22 n=1 Tax=Trachinotus anak TaxID=443729 RepID=UPI0039F1CB2D
MDKEEMEGCIKTMEKAFQAEKEAWEEERGNQLGEIRSFRMKLLVAESHIHLMEEEVKVSKIEIASLKESVFIQRQENAAIKDHWREVIREREDSATKLMESEEKWQRRVSRLMEEIQDNSSVDKMMALIREQQKTLTVLSQTQSEFCQSERRWESKSNTLEESYRKALAEKEESWQKRMEEMERKINLEKMWLQKEGEWRQRTSVLEEELKQLIKENTQLQVLARKKKKRKPWWKRRFKLRRTPQGRGSVLEETPLLSQSQEK